MTHLKDILDPISKVKADFEYCRHHKKLSDILERYEPLIRKRWIKKAHQQRSSILLAAAPNMPRHHRPGMYDSRLGWLYG